MEQTFMLVKPDGVQRGLIGEIIKRVEQLGLKVVALKMMQISTELAAKHYVEHVKKDFYPKLESFIISGPVIAMVVEGEHAVHLIRKLNGATKISESAPGSIRGDFANNTTENIVHGSDSRGSAIREIQLFFSEEEVFSFCKHK